MERNMVILTFFEFLTEMFSYSLCCIPIIHNGMKMIGRLNSKYAQRLEDWKLCHLINSIKFSILLAYGVHLF